MNRDVVELQCTVERGQYTINVYIIKQANIKIVCVHVHCVC